MFTSTSGRRSAGKPPLALIAGPTASGKSSLALLLAERIGGSIVNADSAQVYRDLRHVTARPTPGEESRVPHLLYGYRDGASPCSAADWAEDAKAAIGRVRSDGRLPILVGGTGLYLRALIDGLAPVPAIDPIVRDEVRRLNSPAIAEALRAEDAEAANRIRPSDRTRLARALEVVRSTGRPLAAWQSSRVGGIAGEVDLVPLILLPPRDWLKSRCDDRFAAMFGEEGIEEVERLLARDLPPQSPVLRAIGVQQIAAWIRGEMTQDEALEAGRTATRRYAKRQYTWFRHQAPIGWPRYERVPEGAALEALVERMAGAAALRLEGSSC